MESMEVSTANEADAKVSTTRKHFASMGHKFDGDKLRRMMREVCISCRICNLCNFTLIMHFFLFRIFFCGRSIEMSYSYERSTRQRPGYFEEHRGREESEFQ